MGHERHDHDSFSPTVEIPVPHRRWKLDGEKVAAIVLSIICSVFAGAGAWYGVRADVDVLKSTQTKTEQRVEKVEDQHSTEKDRAAEEAKNLALVAQKLDFVITQLEQLDRRIERIERRQSGRATDAPRE